MKTVFLSFCLLITASLAFAQDVNSIRNFRTVDEGRIYRGGLPNGLDELQLLKSQKQVNTIIDLQGFDIPIGDHSGETSADIATERAQATSLGMRFVSLPMTTLEQFVPPSPAQPLIQMHQFQMAKAAVALLRRPDLYPIYVHCHGGNDRTGLVIALHRVFNEGWPVMKAYREMLDSGHLHNMAYSAAIDSTFFEIVALWKTKDALHLPR